MLGVTMRLLALGGLVPLLSGCFFIYLGYMASIPSPRVSIDVTWAADSSVCKDAIAGQLGQMVFAGLESHHLSQASGRSFTERRYEIWKVATENASFTDFGAVGRGVFDFDNDGALDLIYASPGRVVVGPATAAARNAFESVSNRESALAALGFQVYHREDWLAQMRPATDVELQRVDDVTYLLATLPEIAFDPARPNAPRYRPLWDGQEPTDNRAWPADLYRLGAAGSIDKTCSFLVQSTAYAIGGL